MLYFLYGNDSFRSLEKIKQIINRYRKIYPKSFNFKIIDLEESSFEEFKNELKITSLFPEKKFLLVKNASQNNNFKNQFLKEKNLLKNLKVNIFFYEDKEINSKDPFFVFLLKNSQAEKFEPLKEEQTINWIIKRANFYQKELTKEVAQILFQCLGNDLWALDQEIQKLVLFSEGKKITPTDVQKLIRPKPELDIFKMIDFLGKKNKKEGLIYLINLYQNGYSFSQLLSIITFQFRTLILIKEALKKREVFRLEKKLKIHSFVIKKGLKLVPYFTLEELKKIYQEIFLLDQKIKIGEIPPLLALEMLIAKI